MRNTYNIQRQIEELQKCFTRLDQISNYQNDWDGYGSIKPTLTAIKIARNLLKEIFRAEFSKNINFITTNLSADSEGNIVLEWWGINEKKITFYLGRYGYPIEYIKSSTSKICEMEEGEIHKFTSSIHSNLFRWLRSN